MIFYSSVKILLIKLIFLVPRPLILGSLIDNQNSDIVNCISSLTFSVQSSI